jgi:hypothetical protein
MFYIRSLGMFIICRNNIHTLGYMSSYNGFINLRYQLIKKKEYKFNTIFCILHKNRLRKHDILFIDNMSTQRKFSSLI